jgi:hypothetical protein
MNTHIVSDGHSHTIFKHGKKHTWYVKRLWALSKNLPEFEYEISSFAGFEEDFWFGDRIKPTIKNVLDHHQRCLNADFQYPIIISEDGLIMDGVHRICRAYLEGKKTVRAVRFKKNPEPDVIK